MGRLTKTFSAMRLFNILAVTTGTLASNASDDLSSMATIVSDRTQYFNKPNKVSRITQRLLTKWNDKLINVLDNKGCLVDGASFDSQWTEYACALDAVDSIEHAFNSWLSAHINGEPKNCANILRRNRAKVDSMKAKLNGQAKNGASMMDCPSGFCKGDKCVFDLKNGGFTSNGKVMGRTSEYSDNVIEFSGIKFADSVRFRSPVAITSYDNADFSNDGYSCATTSAVNVGSDSLPVDTEKVEDCLYITIYMKKSALTGPARKVVSWIHGGTFNFGGVDAIYENPATFVDDQDVIIAKFNYRLGPFGNWYFPINLGGQPKSSWSVQDQRMGMAWVHDHISKFNGDAEDITLAGASSGGTSVLVHMTSPDSHALFHNALVMGSPLINFWTAQEASDIYGYITVNVLQCTTEENFVTDAISGDLLNCLQGVPLVNFQMATAAAGEAFKKVALDANHLSQLEQSYAFNFDGDVVLGNPRELIKANSPLVKSDMGFFLQELSPNEGTSMVQNLFGSEDFKRLLYGAAYDQVFQSFNTHILAPKPAHDGLLAQLYGGAGEAFMTGLLQPAGLGCPNPVANDPYQGLMVECKTKTVDWITAWLWHCPVHDALKSMSTGETPANFPIYLVDFSASYPGPNHAEPGVFAMDNAGLQDCYEAGGGLSCHIVGQSYLFGEGLHQDIALTTDELAFGAFYRSAYGELIKNGSSDKLANWSAAQGAYNNMDIGNDGITMSMPHGHTCHMFDMLGMYGAL